MKKWSLIALAVSLVLMSFAGSALAAANTKKSTVKTVTITKIDKGTELGKLYVTTDAETTVQALQKAVTIKDKKITWTAVPNHKNKVFQAAFAGKTKTAYQIKTAAPFALAKGVDAKIVWNSIPAELKEIRQEPELGKFTVVLGKNAQLADLKGKITASAAGVKYAVTLSGSGKTFTGVVSGVKAGVEYKLIFSEPFPVMSMPISWPEPPKEVIEKLPPVEGSVPDAAYGQ